MEQNFDKKSLIKLFKNVLSIFGQYFGKNTNKPGKIFLIYF